MMTILWLVIVSAISALLAIGGTSIAISISERRLANLNRASEQLDAFYLNAQKLVRNKDVPDALVNFVAYLGPRVGTRALAWTFTGIFVHVCLEPGQDGASKGEVSKSLEALPEEQAKIFRTMLMAGIMASVYRDTLFAGVHMLLWNASIKKRHEAIARESAAREQMHQEATGEKTAVKTAAATKSAEAAKSVQPTKGRQPCPEPTVRDLLPFATRLEVPEMIWPAAA